MTNQPRLIGACILIAATAASVSAFQPAGTAVVNRHTTSTTSQHNIGKKVVLQQSLYDDDDEDDDSEGYEIRSSNTASGSATTRPQTTFGAENVPVEQRPSNEYINLMAQPTYGWASQESGDVGLVIRLAAIYVAFYFLV